MSCRRTAQGDPEEDDVAHVPAYQGAKPRAPHGHEHDRREAESQQDSPDRTELVEHQGRTTLTSTARYPSKDVRDKLVAAGANRDVREHYEKLEAFLASASAAQLE